MDLLASIQLLVVSYLIVGSQGTECDIQTDTIRLVGGLSDQGPVEICDTSQWKSVCDLVWTDTNAEIVCRELNLTYSGAQAISGGGCSAFNTSTIDRGILIQCTGEENSIKECGTAVQTNCTAAGVICSSPCDPSFCIDSCLSPTSTCYCPIPSDVNCTCPEAMCSHACQNGGSCAAPGECRCPPGWTGQVCQQAICNPPCSNGGNCIGPDTCQCQDTWEGDACQYAVCSPAFCQNGGRCLYPDENCTCLENWTGKQCNQNIGTEDSTTSIVPAIVTVLVLLLLAVAGAGFGVLIAIRRRRKAVAITTHSARNVCDKSYEAESLSSLQAHDNTHMQPLATQPIAMEAADQCITGHSQSGNSHNGQFETELNNPMVDTNERPGDLGLSSSHNNYSSLGLGIQQLNYTERQPPGENSDNSHSLHPHTDFEAAYDEPKIKTKPAEVEYDSIQEAHHDETSKQKKLHEPPHEYDEPFEPKCSHGALYNTPDELGRTPLTKPPNEYDEPYELRNPHDIISHKQHRSPLATNTRNYSELLAVEYAEPYQPRHPRSQNDTLAVGQVQHDDAHTHREHLQEQKLQEYDKTFAPQNQASVKRKHSFTENSSLDHAAPKTLHTTDTNTNKGFESSAGYSVLTEEKKNLQINEEYSALNWNDDALPSASPVHAKDQLSTSKSSLQEHNPENIEQDIENDIPANTFLDGARTFTSSHLQHL